MARSPCRILSFPMVVYGPPKSAYHADAPDPQLPLNGFELLRQTNRTLADPHVLLLRFRHEMHRVERLAPYMSATALLRLEGEVALLSWAVDAVEAELKRAAERHAKAVGLIA
jgi:hypothetical protein